MIAFAVVKVSGPNGTKNGLVPIVAMASNLLAMASTQ